LGCGQLGHQQRFCRQGGAAVVASPAAVTAQAGAAGAVGGGGGGGGGGGASGSGSGSGAHLSDYVAGAAAHWQGQSAAPSAGGTRAASSGGTVAAGTGTALAGGGKGGGVRGHRRGAEALGLSDNLDSSANDESCVICMDAPAQITLFPCGHNITCAGCTQALLQLRRPCPFCSQPIKGTDLDHMPEAWQRNR
jgi:hypothetical protein